MSLHVIKASRDHRRRLAANGLLNALIAYWPGDEASGNALDAHNNALHLTDNNTVTNAAGKVYSTARQYTAANQEFHSHATDALLSPGNTDFTFAFWVYLDALANRCICTKWGAAGKYEYTLLYNHSVTAFRFAVSGNGTGVATVDATNFGAPSATTWYLVIAWHDSVGNTINIQVNNTTANSQAHTLGVFQADKRFTIGSNDSGSGWMNGRIGPGMLWQSAAGAGGVLTAAQRTALYNGGSGLTHGEFTA